MSAAAHAAATRHRAASRPRRRRRGETLATLLGAGAALALAAGALGDAGVPPAEQPAARLLAGAEGGMVLTNTRQGRAVVRAANLAPGESVRGTVRIGNAGFEDVDLRLISRSSRTVRGLYGGDLGSALRVQVDRAAVARTPRSARSLYEGRLARMPHLDLGRLEAWHGRRYEVRISFPSTGAPPSPTTGDNAYQGATAEVKLIWRATQTD